MILFKPKQKNQKKKQKRTIRLAYEFRDIFGFYPPLDKWMMAMTGEFEINLFELERQINFCSESLQDCVLRKYGPKAVEHLEKWL